MKLLLLTAPMVQINTPYPATAYLKGFLDSCAEAGDLQTTQADPALELVLRLFSPDGLDRIRKALPSAKKEIRKLPGELQFFLEAFEDYKSTVADTVAFLQGKRPELSEVIAAREFFPEGPRFVPLQEVGPLLDQFLAMEEADRAQHLASLCLDDLADFVKLGADPRFEFSRYGEKLAASQPSFDLLREELESPPTVVDELLSEITAELLAKHKPDIVGISVPFSGTVYAALRMGKQLRAQKIPVLLGGGYCNTELRSLRDPRLFDYVDFITLDDGERPLLYLLEFFRGTRKKEDLFRTKYRDANLVAESRGQASDIPFRETGTPTYEGLEVSDYIKMFEMLNPVTRLWSGYFWNKLTLAHGCYWRKCSFCDTSLDYIGRYEAAKATDLADKMDAIARQTGSHGFHFVDEAAPPAILKALSEELLRRGRRYEWWGNIRFDKTFTPELTKLMKEAGCIAVTGGLEVASERVLKLINKGVSLEQVARVAKAFHDNGVFVHAYLMYGFPTETAQETVDSLEVVRQLFANECLQSGFWHRFSATVHSPVGKAPTNFGIRIVPFPSPAHGLFAENDLRFVDPTGVDHDALGEGLRRALYNFMHGQGLKADVRDWFPIKVPKTRIPAKLIAGAVAT